MKKLIIILVGLLISLPLSLIARDRDNSGPSFGWLFMGGVRYDDVRMCVATDAGVKGGPMADIQLVTRWHLDPDTAIAFNLPVMRPILFLAAFDMIQFEPELNLEFYRTLDGGSRIVTGPGLGLSYHYGPGYESDLSNPGDSFSAFGPVFNWKLAVVMSEGQDNVTMIGGKLFYTLLNARDHADGKVIGLAFEYQMGF